MPQETIKICIRNEDERKSVLKEYLVEDNTFTIQKEQISEINQELYGNSIHHLNRHLEISDCVGLKSGRKYTFETTANEDGSVTVEVIIERD